MGGHQNISVEFVRWNLGIPFGTNENELAC